MSSPHKSVKVMSVFSFQIENINLFWNITECYMLWINVGQEDPNKEKKIRWRRFLYFGSLWETLSLRREIIERNFFCKQLLLVFSVLCFMSYTLTYFVNMWSLESLHLVIYFTARTEFSIFSQPFGRFCCFFSDILFRKWCDTHRIYRVLFWVKSADRVFSHICYWFPAKVNCYVMDQINVRPVLVHWFSFGVWLQCLNWYNSVA